MGYYAAGVLATQQEIDGVTYREYGALAVEWLDATRK